MRTYMPALSYWRSLPPEKAEPPAVRTADALDEAGDAGLGIGPHTAAFALGHESRARGVDDFAS